MKPALAALFFLLALSPARAQNPATPCSNPDQFGGSEKAWKAAFDSVETGYGALSDETKASLTAFLQAQDHPNAACAAPKGGSPGDCGAFVDHLMLAKRGVTKHASQANPNYSTWRAAGETLDSVAANPIYSELCRMQAERTSGGARGGGGYAAGASQSSASIEQQRAAQAAAQQKTLALAKRVLAEANASGIGAPSTPSPASAAPAAAPAPASSPSPFALVTTTFSGPCKGAADQNKCWCDIAASQDCQTHETGACMNAASMCPSLGH